MTRKDIAVLSIIIACMWIAMILFAQSISVSAAPTMTSTYVSAWTWVLPDEVKTFAHKSGVLPAFADVMIAPYLQGTTSFEPTTVVPYVSWTNGCAEIEYITKTILAFHNSCGESLYVRVTTITP